MQAYVVLDLGFGDSGKGLLTDFLVRHHGAGLVVRYNGGAQAGHNVVAPDGRHHTFSQFGSGTFVPGVKTFLSRHVVIHPTGLLVEAQALERVGVRDALARLRVSDRALVITPFHQAANRIREIVRGKGRHGSCGVGVGEAVEDALANPQDSVRAGDLGNVSRLKRKLQIIREQKCAQLGGLGQVESQRDPLAREWEILTRGDVIDEWIASVSQIDQAGVVVPDAALRDWMQRTETVVWEGAQGVLLDAERGLHPYTTWSRCTAENADELIAEMRPDARVCRIGVIRSYAVRHGPGPLPTETDALAPVVFDHNTYNPWQRDVRYGWFDAVLARYALEVAGGVDALAVTHLDVLSRLAGWKYGVGYRMQNGSAAAFGDVTPDGVLKDLRVPRDLSLDERTRLTEALVAAQPMLEACAADEGQVIRKIESLVGQSVRMVSRGPSAENIEIMGSLSIE